jgi:hypothetical protein
MRCSDCDVDLVEELPSGRQPTKPRSALKDDRMSQEVLPDWDEMRSVWEGDDAVECADVCRQLQQEEIRYSVDQSILSREARMGVKWKYQIQVGATDYQKARKTLGYEEAEGKELPDEAENEAATELPARDDLPVEDVHGDWNPRGWYPEDATLQVWSGNPIERGSVVEMSLKENRINYRVAMESDELKRVFVKPEDEAQAREIVREIVEGEPPE